MTDKYRDGWPTCLETFATLRVSCDGLGPGRVTETLKIEPTSTQERGARKPGSKELSDAWFYSSKGLVESRDTRRHIDFVLGAVAPRKVEMMLLTEMGCKIDISNYWVSATGHGGPQIDPEQMKILAELDISIWWDIYFN